MMRSPMLLHRVPDNHYECCLMPPVGVIRVNRLVCSVQRVLKFDKGDSEYV